MIKTSRLKFYYSESDVFDFPRVELVEKEDLLILGESGVGKSTLLQLFSGLLTPVKGQIEINGTGLSTLNHKEKDRFRGREIGVVLQRPHFVRSLSVYENMLLVIKLSGKQKNEKRVLELLEKVGLAGKEKKKTYELSQGQQQRLSIAMALIKDPSVVLADEPTSSLDDKNCQSIIDLLKEETARTNAHLIIVTHDNRVKPHFKNVLQL